VPEEAVEVLCCKTMFRNYLKEKGWPVPAFCPLDHCAGFLGKPGLIKPDKSSGARGIRRVFNESDWCAAEMEARQQSGNGSGLWEEFVQGHQGTCEGLWSDGRILFHRTTDRLTAPEPWVTTVGHALPTNLKKEVEARLLSMLSAIWSDLGVRRTLFDVDFIVRNDDIYLLEMTPRVGGNSIVKLIRASTGVDLTEWAIRLAIDPDFIPKDLHAPERPVLLRILGLYESGQLDFNEEAARALGSEPDVVEFSLDGKFGMPVYPFTSSRNRLGEILLCGLDRKEMEIRIKKMLQWLNLRVVNPI
jgi:biotin carboxylase